MHVYYPRKYGSFGQGMYFMTYSCDPIILFKLGLEQLLPEVV